MHSSVIPRLSERGKACAALALLVFFSRAWLISVWGSPLPYWDQWDAEGSHLLHPWLAGSLRWTDLFVPHNEHRIALTRIADLVLFIAGGRWNIWWELMLNAILHAATAAGLACFFRPVLAGANRALMLFGLAVAFTAPSGWQNALWGFQSQVYFCSLLSLLALAGLLLPEPLKWRWWSGWIAALIVLFSQGSGVLAATAALATLIFSRLAGASPFSSGPGLIGPFPGKPPAAWKPGFSLFALIAVVVAGWMLRVSAPQHATMQAKSLIQFSNVFLRCLGWPWVNSGWMWLAMQAPALWFIGRFFHQRTAPVNTEKLALGLFFLTLLNAAAIAYSRGAGLPDARPLSRYQDPLLLGVAANLFLALRLGSHHRFGRPAALLWLGALLAGLMILTTTNLSLNLPYKRQQDRTSLLQIQTYLENHDGSTFTTDPNLAGPQPSSSAIKEVLDDSVLLPVLPTEIRHPAERPPWLIESSVPLLITSTILFLWILKKNGDPRPSDENV